MSALRIARAATGRSKVAQVRRLLSRPRGRDAREGRQRSGRAGRRRRAPASPTGTLARHARRAARSTISRSTACSTRPDRRSPPSIVEPLPANYGLLPQRADVARATSPRAAQTAGALLIFDEVISGFRIGLRRHDGRARRAARIWSATARSSAAGSRSAPMRGRADLMDLVAPVGDRVSGRHAQRESGRHARRPGDARRRWNASTAGAMLDARGRDVRRRSALALPTVADAPAIVHHGSLFWCAPTHGSIRSVPDRIHADQAAWFAKFFHAALARGVYLPPAGVRSRAFSRSRTTPRHSRHAAAALADAARESGTREATGTAQPAVLRSLAIVWLVLTVSLASWWLVFGLAQARRLRTRSADRAPRA